MRRQAAVLALVALAACDQRMGDQPRYEPYEPSDLFPDGKAMQAPAAGSVARSAPERVAALLTPPPMTPALLARGRERYDVFCAPCHGLAGYGDGMIPRRGFPPPPSYHTDRLRAKPPQYVVRVITEGYGIMYSYAARVDPFDRWAIAAYVRALQVSQHAEAERLPAEVRALLPEGR